MEPQLTSLVFPNLAAGWDPLAPPRALHPAAGGPVWRDAQNVRMDEGRLFPRGALMSFKTFTDGLAFSYPVVDLNTFDQNSQTPLVILQEHFVDPLFDVSGSGAVRVITFVVTTSEIFIHNPFGSGWINATPTWSTGSISVAAGSSTVTGFGTSWQDVSIRPGNLLRVGAAWHRITAVLSNTSLAIAPPAAAGFSGAYTIRRTFQSEVSFPLRYGLVGVGPAFARLHNGDLYVATPLGSGRWGAVIKVEEVLTSSPVATYLTSTLFLTPGIDFTTAVCYAGLELLGDGRVVVAAATQDSPLGARALYSSHLNQAVWTTSPGGFTDVVELHGQIRALGRSGRALTLHFADGVALGYPTGEDDPPLAFEPTAAVKGCCFPRTLKETPLGEMGVADDFQVYIWDRSSARPVGDPIRRELSARPTLNFPVLLHAAIDSYRSKYWLFACLSPTQATLAFAYDWLRGRWERHEFPVGLSAVSDKLIADPGSDGAPNLAGRPTANRDRHGTACAGVISSYRHDTSGANVTTRMLYALSESALVDVAELQLVATSTFATSDDLDFGLPGTDKMLSHVVVWFVEEPGAATLQTWTVGASGDGGSTWTEVSKTFAVLGGMETPVPFYFEPAAAEQWRIRLTRVSMQRRTAATRMEIWVASLGRFEAVR